MSSHSATNGEGADRFYYERALLMQGCHRIAGVDEAGRGPLAGPVFAAAVVFPESWIVEGMPEGLRGLTDSKQLTERQRESYFQTITENPNIHWAWGSSDQGTIDRMNVLQATHWAMHAALSKLAFVVDHVLIDGLDVPLLGEHRTALVKGDSKSYSIAAASVVAKVLRDRFMVEADAVYPQYGFGQHKGYGTRQHLASLRRFGPCALHRFSFAPVRQLELE